MDPEKLMQTNKEKELVQLSKRERASKKREFPESKIAEIVSTSFSEVEPRIKLDEKLFERLKLIERYSEINSYSRMISAGVENILDGTSGENKEKVLKAKIAALIHDVGKSGPVSATPDQQISVIRLFSAEGLKDGKQKVEDAVKESFGEEANTILQNLKGCGIDLSMSMREFWDAHTVWGSEINDKYSRNSEGIPAESIAIADLHHAYKGPDNLKYNPRQVPIEKILEEAFAVGILEEFLSVVIIDQYEAFSDRSGLAHEKAIEKVRSNIPKEFCSSYPSICKSIDEILGKMSKMRPEEIFRGSKEII